MGVSLNGKVALSGAYGMADLEHDTKNTVDTVFEAGSVSKQFTAAAVLLLARDGKLSLDDPARKYIPELPDYGTPLTIRHMLAHTSGLRDWGELAGLAGWPRGTRVHTDGDVLAILSRQRALNFPPGTLWSYSNSGFNLAEILVSRVSGQSLAEFTRQRLFVPLGMTHTSWREDYTRIVKRRAIAYREAQDGYHQEMPFENIYGQGGLLTTVGDLLKWNEYLSSPGADAEIVNQMQTEGHLNDGKPHGYGLGLFVSKYRGVNEIAHAGQTASYTAYLARYPNDHVSLAVLCNASGDGNATRLAHEVADLYLRDHLEPMPPASPAPESAPASVKADEMPMPAPEQLQPLAGRYTNDEVGGDAVVTASGASLSVRFGTNVTFPLQPRGQNKFAGNTWLGDPGGVIFERDGTGRATALVVTTGRVWNMRFVRKD